MTRNYGPKLAIICLLILFLGLFGLPKSSEAALLACDGSDSSSPAWPTGTGCQAAINYASDGDIISIPAGSYVWNTGLTWEDKNIGVIGAGAGITNISGSGRPFGVSISNINKASWRISGFTFGGSTAPPQVLSIWAGGTPTYSYGWRFDHNKLNYSASVQNDPIYIQGVTFGLIDHVYFGGYGNVYIAIYGYQNVEDGSSTSKLFGTYNLNLAPI